MQPPPRSWYRNSWWILTAILLAAVGGIVHGLTRSDVPPRVGADTTIITKPLAADGLPDYAAHILALQGRGQPPKGNAAVILLETFWPLEIDAAHLPAICAELGIPLPEPPPGPLPEFDFTRIGEILDTLLAARPESDDEPAVPSASQPPADAHAETTATDPKRDAEYRQQLDDWCSRHATALDRATVAAQRPRLYLPPRRLLDCDRGDVMGSLQDGIGGLRSIAYALQLRTLWRLHSGHTAAAWDDIRASCRLARQLAVREQPGAAALAAFRAERRDGGLAVYPDRLDDLVPGQFAEVPLDPFTGRPFVYERRGDGYLLYSLGPDADDDLGTSRDRKILRGEWSSEEDWGSEDDDVVIRMPLPSATRGD